MGPNDGNEEVQRQVQYAEIERLRNKLAKVRILLRGFRRKNGNLLSCREGKEWDRLVKELEL